MPRMEDGPQKKSKNLDLVGDTNCGVKDGCAADAFPVRLFTGNENKEYPKICVNGK